MDLYVSYFNKFQGAKSAPFKNLPSNIKTEKRSSKNRASFLILFFYYDGYVYCGSQVE
jgi:hypothetical protein